LLVRWRFVLGCVLAAGAGLSLLVLGFQESGVVLAITLFAAAVVLFATWKPS
jgi:hypothetical protein